MACGPVGEICSTGPRIPLVRPRPKIAFVLVSQAKRLFPALPTLRSLLVGLSGVSVCVGLRVLLAASVRVRRALAGEENLSVEKRNVASPFELTATRGPEMALMLDPVF